MDKHITAPFDKKQVEELHAGDYVYISGVIYSARDAAHKRMYDTLIENENDESKLPIKLEGNVIYYLGPTPAREGRSSDRQDQQPAVVWTNTHHSFFQKV